MWGLSRTLVANMVEGVSKGFTKRLVINGVGYRAAIDGKILNLQLGYSHDIKYAVPQDIDVKCESPTAITHHGRRSPAGGPDRRELRSFRLPEPYKGKGIRYDNEVILRKEGKKSKAMVKPTERFLGRRERTQWRCARRPTVVPTVGVPLSKHIYAQVIDDQAGRTLAAASTLDSELRAQLKTGADRAAAEQVGKLIADRAKGAGVEAVVFDRGAYRCHGPHQGAGRCGAPWRLGVLRHNKDRGITLMRRRGDMSRTGGDERQEGELVDRLVNINRVAKVVKAAGARLLRGRGGRRRQGPGRPRQRQGARGTGSGAQGDGEAKRAMIRVPLRQAHLHHDIEGRFGAGRVVLRAAPPGTGIIAGGPMRAVFELGIADVVAKSISGATRTT